MTTQRCPECKDIFDDDFVEPQVGRDGDTYAEDTNFWWYCPLCGEAVDDFEEVVDED